MKPKKRILIAVLMIFLYVVGHKPSNAMQARLTLLEYRYERLPTLPPSGPDSYEVLLLDDPNHDQVVEFLRAYVEDKETAFVRIYTDRRGYEEAVRMLAENDNNATGMLARGLILTFLRNPALGDSPANNCITWLQLNGRFDHLFGTTEPLD